MPGWEGWTYRAATCDHCHARYVQRRPWVKLKPVTWTCECGYLVRFVVVKWSGYLRYMAKGARVLVNSELSYDLYDRREKV